MLINDHDLPVSNLTSFYESKMRNQWIIISRKSFDFSVCHSRIDEPLYFYHNSTLLYLNLMYSKIHKLQEDLLRHTRSGLGLKIIQNIFMKEEAIF